MQGLVRMMVVLSAMVVAVVAMPVVAAAEPEAGQEFGDHISACAQAVGFDGTHNPGMHEGFADWPAVHDC